MTSNFYFSPCIGRDRALLMVGAGTVVLLAGASRAASAAGVPGFAAQVMLAKPWQPALSPAGYLVSEKLDGVRALWDGRQLRFRSGRPIAAPAWFMAGLPDAPLDGELWMGRHSFEVLSGAVRRQVPVDAEWRLVRYMVFDMPRRTRLPGALRAWRRC
jgi:DNA ligase-1